MIIRRGPAFWAILFSLTFALSVYSQGRRNGQQQQQQQQQVQAQNQGVGPQCNQPPELKAFNEVQNEKDPEKQVKSAEDFIRNFPNSECVFYAHTIRMIGYSQLGKSKEAIAAGEQAIDATVKLGEKVVAKAEADSNLSDKDRENAKKKDKTVVFYDKNSPQFAAFMDQMEQRILSYSKSVMQLSLQMNDAPKAIEFGEKALGHKPDDFETLQMLSSVMAERPPTNEAEKTKHMQRAEELATQALKQLPTVLASPDAAKLTPAQKADMTAQLHYTLGLINLHQKKYGLSQQELLTALQSNAKDPVIYYRLGYAYLQETKLDQAMDALAKSVFLKGVPEQQARDILKQLYVNKNKSEEGLEDYIKSAGAKIGQ